MKMLESRIENMGSEHAKAIGDRMRTARKEAGLTIRELAARMGISPTHLNRMENGERLMDSVQNLISFCEICHVPIEDFLILCGMKITDSEMPVYRAFPAIRSKEEAEAISQFAKAITSRSLTNENISQMVNTAIAFADFCDKQNQQNQQ